MCKYCNANVLEDLAINKKDEAVIINQNIETNEYFIDGFETEIPINYCPMCRKEARRVNCKGCKYCKQIGRTKGERFSLGRKEYFCENPEVYNLKDGRGNPIYNFIGYGDTTIKSPLQLKTSKRWCPLNKEDKQ